MVNFDDHVSRFVLLVVCRPGLLAMWFDEFVARFSESFDSNYYYYNCYRF